MRTCLASRTIAPEMHAVTSSSKPSPGLVGTQSCFRGCYSEPPMLEDSLLSLRVVACCSEGQGQARTDKNKNTRHPAAKGVRQKESGKKVTKKVTKASEKVTEK